MIMFAALMVLGAVRDLEIVVEELVIQLIIIQPAVAVAEEAAVGVEEVVVEAVVAVAELQLTYPAQAWLRNVLSAEADSGSVRGEEAAEAELPATPRGKYQAAAMTAHAEYAPIHAHARQAKPSALA